MTKQIITDVECCKGCLFSHWYYNDNPKGEENITYWVCEHSNMLQDEVLKEKIIENINSIPNWCPLPDKKD